MPEVTSEESEEFWSAACALHPEWEHVTWRDPIDPTLFPITSSLWAECHSGAQMAGLIRLEDIATRGGFYVDSDYEVFRALDPLRGSGFVAGWEDQHTVPDFFFGGETWHPAFELLLSDAVRSVPNGAWQSGPGAFTRVLPGRPDVLLLPPQAFAPYHYGEKRRRDERWSDDPWCFGAHHWAFSWAGEYE